MFSGITAPIGAYTSSGATHHLPLKGKAHYARLPLEGKLSAKLTDEV